MASDNVKNEKAVPACREIRLLDVNKKTKQQLLRKIIARGIFVLSHTAKKNC